MSSRMLKELKGLAPWQWDSRVTKHPPGSKALSDFERVEHVMLHAEPGQARTRQNTGEPGKDGTPIPGGGATPFVEPPPRRRSASHLESEYVIETPALSHLSKKLSSNDRAKSYVRHKVAKPASMGAGGVTPGASDFGFDAISMRPPRAMPTSATTPAPLPRPTPGSSSQNMVCPPGSAMRMPQGTPSALMSSQRMPAAPQATPATASEWAASVQRQRASGALNAGDVSDKLRLLDRMDSLPTPMGDTPMPQQRQNLLPPGSTLSSGGRVAAMSSVQQPRVPRPSPYSSALQDATNAPERMALLDLASPGSKRSREDRPTPQAFGHLPERSPVRAAHSPIPASVQQLLDAAEAEAHGGNNNVACHMELTRGDKAQHADEQQQQLERGDDGTVRPAKRHAPASLADAAIVVAAAVQEPASAAAQPDDAPVLSAPQLGVLNQLLQHFRAIGCKHPANMTGPEIVRAISSFCQAAVIPPLPANIKTLASWLGTLLSLDSAGMEALLASHAAQAQGQAHATAAATARPPAVAAAPRLNMQTGTASPLPEAPMPLQLPLAAFNILPLDLGFTPTSLAGFESEWNATLTPASMALHALVMDAHKALTAAYQAAATHPTAIPPAAIAAAAAAAAMPAANTVTQPPPQALPPLPSWAAGATVPSPPAGAQRVQAIRPVAQRPQPMQLQKQPSFELSAAAAKPSACSSVLTAMAFPGFPPLPQQQAHAQIAAKSPTQASAMTTPAVAWTPGSPGTAAGLSPLCTAAITLLPMAGQLAKAGVYAAATGKENIPPGFEQGAPLQPAKMRAKAIAGSWGC